MGVNIGNSKKVYLKTTSGSTTSYDWLTGEQSNSLNRSNSAVDISDKSSKWQKFIGGLLGATADITVHADNSDDQQKAMLDALESGAEVDVFIGILSSDAPSDGDAFSAIVTAVNDSNDNGSVSSRSISLQVSGPITHYPA